MGTNDQTRQEQAKRWAETERVTNEMERNIGLLASELESAIKRHSYFTRQLKRHTHFLQTAKVLGQTRKIAEFTATINGALEAHRKATVDLKVAYDRYFASI